MKPGKYIYTWHPRLYPKNDVVKYALGLGADGLVMLDATPGAVIEEAARTFPGKVYLWAFPGKFVPSEAVETTHRLKLQALAHGLKGIVVDPETAPKWLEGREELPRFAAAMDDARRRGLEVGLTSFPFWPYVHKLAPHCDFISPQLYGRDGTTNPDVFRNWRSRWDATRVQVVPSLWANAGGRNIPKQGEYLGLFADEPANILFQSPVPKPQTAVYKLQKDFMMDGAPTNPKGVKTVPPECS